MGKIRVSYTGAFHTECRHEESRALIETDAPKDNEGKGEAFSPTDLFAASLGSCMLTIMAIAARKMGLEIKGSNADVEKIMVSSPKRRIGKLIVRIRCPFSFDQPVREKLESAALQCPVHESLHPDIKQEIEFVWGL